MFWELWYFLHGLLTLGSYLYEIWSEIFGHHGGITHNHEMQKQPLEVFCKKSVLKSFTKFTEKHLCQIDSVSQELIVSNALLRCIERND